MVATIVLVALTFGLRFWLPCYRQMAAVRAIEGSGGKVGTVHHLPNWARSIIGNPNFKAFEEVDFVNWEGSLVCDSDLDPLRSLRTIRRLNLRHTRISDAGLARLKGLADLQQILVRGTDITDAAIADIQRAMPGLKVVE